MLNILGLDLDGVITNAPEFYSVWTHSWTGKDIAITYRRDRSKAIADLEERNIRYDEVVLVDRLAAKAQVIDEPSPLASKSITLIQVNTERATGGRPFIRRAFGDLCSCLTG